MEDRVQGCNLKNIERLEQYWHRLLIAFPQTKDAKGVVIACYPELPMPLFHHTADVKVNEDEVSTRFSR